jgi:hypothetical protein
LYGANHQIWPFSTFNQRAGKGFLPIMKRFMIAEAKYAAMSSDACREFLDRVRVKL